METEPEPETRGHIIATTAAIVLQVFWLQRDRRLFDSLTEAEKAAQGGQILASVIRSREVWLIGQNQDILGDPGLN